MIIVYLAVCMLTTPAQQCNRGTAVDWFETDEPQMDLSSCMIHGQMVAARRQILDGQTYLKVFCRMPGPTTTAGTVG
jgi:hypothetical protein